MKKLFILWVMVFSALFAVDRYTPAEEIHIDGAAKDMVIAGDHLIVGTDSGKLQVYDYVQKKMIKEISIPPIKDFMGDTISARVASVDRIGEKYLLLSDSGKGGYADLRIHENNSTKTILSAEDKKPVIKARFIDKDHILLAYLSNEVSLLDINTGKELYRTQLSESKFSDFALTVDKKLAAFGCESGEIAVVDTMSGKILHRFNELNLDNVYKVDIKNGYVAGAGQDRRGTWYNIKTGKGGFVAGSFLIYAVALSPSAQRVAYALDEKNNISVYDMNTHSKIALLEGQKSTMISIIFKDENTLFSASDDDTVMMWKIK